MNWLTVAVLGAIAGWFEFNYQKSRRRKGAAAASAAPPEPSATAEAVQVERPGMQPSIGPGAEVDKKLSTET
jgi:hypothetical protein